MLETFKIFPLWLTITTVIFVILPAIFSGFTRRSLYIHLEDLEKKTRRLVSGDNQGIQPRFINLLQQRFAKASQQIENVNTIALIDGVYHQETITFFNFNIRCEEAEYITKTIPNLLLAFGLLGTFLGITLNLNSISQIINTGGTNIIDLTSQLQQPLQSMGIAFITSLIGLFCSSILTIINLKYNISLEKNSLLNNLEDYLDNIYKVKIKGYSRLDEAVNKMVDKQTEFLTRFHENVGQVLERTFKQAADRIADENEKSQQLAYQVYQSLLDASGAINTGANIFKNSITKLDNQVQSIQRIMPIFRSNIESFDRSSNLILTASSKIEESKFSENLEKITFDLAQTQSKFTEATKLLAESTLALKNDNQKATNLAQQVYEQLKNASESLEESSILFADSATTIKDSQFNQNLVKATANLDTIQQQFLEIVKTLNDVIKPISINVKTLEVSTDKMVKLAQNVDRIESNINTINYRYLEMTNTSREILLKLGENTVENNERYSEMTNISRDILLKLGESTVKNTNSYSELFKSLEKINKELEERLKLFEKNEKFMLLLMRKLFENSYNQNKSSSRKKSGWEWDKSSERNQSSQKEEWERFWNEDWQKMWDEDWQNLWKNK